MAHSFAMIATLKQMLCIMKIPLLFIFLFVPTTAQINTAIPGQSLLFKDTFEDNATFSWTIFEELVNSCATTGTGTVVRNTTVYFQGHASLSVMSNAKRVPGSNHVLAQQKLANVGVTGLFTYQVFVYIDPDIVPTTQTGPEFSLQSTLPIGLTAELQPIMRTMIGGLQYVGNSFVSNKWRLWAKTPSSVASGSGESAAWVDVDTAGGFPNLSSEKGWWKLFLVMDFSKQQYVHVSFKSPKGIISKVKLHLYSIAQEVKFTDSGLSATLEAQNLYDCTGTHVNTVFYDNVKIQQLKGSIPISISMDSKTSTLFVGSSDTWVIPPDRVFVILQVPIRGTANISNNSSVTYTATSPGGDSMKLRVCDTTNFSCMEVWWTIVSPNQAPMGANVRIETTHCDSILTMESPITDPDGNLNITSAEVLTTGTGVQVLPSGQFTMDMTGKVGSGEVGTQVQVCDALPWRWCASAWIVVSWKCSLV